MDADFLLLWFYHNSHGFDAIFGHAVGVIEVGISRAHKKCCDSISKQAVWELKFPLNNHAPHIFKKNMSNSILSGAKYHFVLKKHTLQEQRSTSKHSLLSRSI